MTLGEMCAIWNKRNAEEAKASPQPAQPPQTAGPAFVFVDEQQESVDPDLAFWEGLGAGY